MTSNLNMNFRLLKTKEVARIKALNKQASPFSDMRPEEVVVQAWGRYPAECLI